MSDNDAPPLGMGSPALLSARLVDAASPLGERFLAALADARRAFPEVHVDTARFARHVAGFLAPTGSGESPGDTWPALEGLNIGDLYLACACASGEQAALAYFDRTYLYPLRTFVKDVDESAAQLDDLKQQLRERLLVGDGSRNARISDYSGRGALGAWVQVAARRLALGTLRGGTRALSPISPPVAVETLGPDPELDILRAHYASEFRDAVRTALKELTSRERRILRLHWIDGLSLTKIGFSYGVSQSTVSRWFAEIRQKMHERTERRLREILGVDDAELESLVRLVQSQLDLSISEVLSAEALP